MPLPEAEMRIWNRIMTSGELDELVDKAAETQALAAPVSFCLDVDQDCIASIAELQDFIVGSLTSGRLDEEQQQIAYAFIDAALEAFDTEAFLIEHIEYEDTESARIAKLKMPKIYGGIDE